MMSLLLGIAGIGMRRVRWPHFVNPKIIPMQVSSFDVFKVRLALRSAISG